MEPERLAMYSKGFLLFLFHLDEGILFEIEVFKGIRVQGLLFCFFSPLIFGRLFPLISFISMDINDSPVPIPILIYVSCPSFPNKS
jgi:hypothetical protein